MNKIHKINIKILQFLDYIISIPLEFLINMLIIVPFNIINFIVKYLFAYYRSGFYESVKYVRREESPLILVYKVLFINKKRWKH